MGNTCRQEERREHTMNLLKRYPITAFFILAFILSWSIRIPMALFSLDAAPLKLLAEFGPAIAALIVTGAVNGKAGVRTLLGRVPKFRVNPWWYVLVLFGPAALQLVSIGVFVLLGGPGGQDKSQPHESSNLDPSYGSLWPCGLGDARDGSGHQHRRDEGGSILQGGVDTGCQESFLRAANALEPGLLKSGEPAGSEKKASDCRCQDGPIILLHGRCGGCHSGLQFSTANGFDPCDFQI